MDIEKIRLYELAMHKNVMNTYEYEYLLRKAHISYLFF